MAIGNNILVPGSYVTIDASKAVNGALVGPSKSVVIGQMTSDGNSAAETFEQVFSEEDAVSKYGRGSTMHELFKYWFKNNQLTQVYGVALDDNGGGTAGTQTLTVTGTATAAGTVYLYINGIQKQIGVASGDTPTVIAAAIAAAVGAASTDEDFPMTGGAAVGVATLTAKNAGTLGNNIDVRLNLNAGEELPAGVTSIVVATGVTGATDPTLADGLNAVPDDVVNFWAQPYTDTTSLTALVAELEARWANTVQLDGQAIISDRDSAANVVTFANTLNSEFVNGMDAGVAGPMPSYIWMAATAGRTSAAIDEDAARPLATLELAGIIGDTKTNKRTFLERQSILSAGFGTHLVADDGSVRIERMVTTNKTNAAAAATTAYQNTNTVANLSFERQSFNARMLSAFPRHKIADDGSAFGAGQPIATPLSVRGEIVALYEQWILLGLTEDLTTFKNTLVVERDVVNRSRMNVIMQPILVGQLYQFDATIEFIL